VIAVYLALKPFAVFESSDIKWTSRELLPECMTLGNVVPQNLSTYTRIPREMSNTVTLSNGHLLCGSYPLPSRLNSRNSNLTIYKQTYNRMSNTRAQERHMNSNTFTTTMHKCDIVRYQIFAIYHMGD